ncbi:SDR family NAD(P)-dependent oxidoreductase [Chitinophaga sp. GCM10012297]|uniref:SDR family oxidoreductase n=1 Tax=Chitinophaga chungangae TaxID=2821488 RepID=A0ABS3YAC0_9BACT|nr:SDR family oxidoreductase [Chitinophaga chungangae]MBO9151619.1 SDR family oxidoreductase [Chitinophaga chungangae]
MDLHLKGKTAVITGASQGFGRAIAKGLASEGVKIFATARNEELLKSLHEETGAVTFAQDFTAPGAPQAIANAALAALGRVDILVNNAGRSRALGVTGDEEEWEAGFTLDFTRHRQLTQHLLPHMMERSQGVILNVTSTYELRSINVSAVAKGAVAVWSKQLAGQLGQYNIRVNCLQPGLIDTANTQRIFTAEERRQFAQNNIPLGDFGQPEDIANMAAFLASPRAGYITGAVAVVDGGLRYHPF